MPQMRYVISVKSVWMRGSSVWCALGTLQYFRRRNVDMNPVTDRSVCGDDFEVVLS